MKFKQELYYIVSLDNLPSIIQHGILCYDLASKIRHCSIANDDVQRRRTNKKINNKPLHSFVNLYFNARNPMMYKVRFQHESICVLGVSAAVLGTESAVISDMNAARQMARYFEPEEGLKVLDFDDIYITNWNVSDMAEKERLVGVLCAELLIQNKIDFGMVNRAYVSNNNVKAKIQDMKFTKEIIIKPDMFFQ